MSSKKIQSALISVFYKDGLEPIVKLLHKNEVKIYSTGGTQNFIEELGIPVIAVEDLTKYPSIFGGRVKTLHPKVFGGILYRRENEDDVKTAAEYDIPAIDLVIVDLYPFAETVKLGASEEDIIEKIDIGGISLIRGACKNFNDVLIVSSREQYVEVLSILENKDCGTELADRKLFAAKGFRVTSAYDTAIFDYFNGGLTDSSDSTGGGTNKVDKIIQNSVLGGKGNNLRYGENPHQSGTFFGDLDALFDKLHGKELSYNNLVDVDACISLLDEFNETAFVIIKHMNACGVATGKTVKKAFK